MLWLLSGQPGFYCSGIQFDLLLSPYLYFISLLYLDLYVLGDDDDLCYLSYIDKIEIFHANQTSIGLDPHLK